LAGLGRKEFNSGDILLASEVQGYLQDQAVMVFDDDTARGSAIPTPSEGMLTYNKDTSGLELYDGAAFVGVGSDSGLIHIKTVSTGGAVSSFSVNDCFSADYRAYRIVTDLTYSTNSNVDFRLRVGGADESGSVYRQQNLTANNTSIGGDRSVNQTSWTTFIASRASVQTSYFHEIYNPFQTLATSAIGMNPFDHTADIIYGLRAYGINNTTSYTGFSLLLNTGTINGTVTVLGYKK
jgi:hypothetical protein